jgi:hypothetical protein
MEEVDVDALVAVAPSIHPLLPLLLVAGSTGRRLSCGARGAEGEASGLIPKLDVAASSPVARSVRSICKTFISSMFWTPVANTRSASLRWLRLRLLISWSVARSGAHRAAHVVRVKTWRVSCHRRPCAQAGATHTNWPTTPTPCVRQRALRGRRRSAANHYLRPTGTGHA